MQQPAPQQSNGEKLLNELLDKAVEYKPFLAENPIKLSARLVLRYLVKPTKSGKVCTPEQAVKFMMLCQSRGLNPWEGDAYIVGYDGREGPEFNLITAHQAFLKRAEVHPGYDGMTSGVIVKRKSDGQTVELEGDYFDEGEVVVGGWARVHFKNRTHAMYKRLKLSAFAKSYGVWQSNAAGMIVKCAEADALRSAFPNECGGMYLDGELQDLARETPAEPPPLPAGRMDLRTPRPTAPAVTEPDPAPADDSDQSHDQDNERSGLMFSDPPPDAAPLKKDTLKSLKTVIKELGITTQGVASALKHLGIRGAEDESPVEIDKLSDGDARRLIQELETPTV